MKAYTYKDSDIEWLGAVPSHWTYDKLFRLCDNVGSGGTPQSTNQSYYDGDIFWVQSGDLTDSYVYDTKKKINELAIQNSSAKVFPENTLLVAMYGATIGKVGIMTFEGAINQACCALDFSSKINPKFSYYLMLNARDYLITQAYGGGQQNISQETLKQLHLFYPSVEEQKVIVSFLDKATARIDSVLSIKRAQLQNLSLQRKSIIHEAVTGKSKLNINCETKDSGIEWLGEIPSHWKVDRIKDVSSLRDQKVRVKSEDENYLELENIEQSTGRTISFQNTLEVGSAVMKFEKGDVLFGKLRPYLEKYYLAEKNGYCTGEILAIEPVKINGKFLKYFLASPNFIKQCTVFSYGTKMPRVNWQTQIGTFLIAIPPLTEQKDIANYLDTVLEKSLKLEEYIYSQIKTLQNYRKSLIHECVTGKKQVTDRIE